MGWVNSAAVDNNWQRAEPGLYGLRYRSRFRQM